MMHKENKNKQNRNTVKHFIFILNLFTSSTFDLFANLNLQWHFKEIIEAIEDVRLQ